MHPDKQTPDTNAESSPNVTYSDEIKFQALCELPPELVLPGERANEAWNPIADGITAHGFSVELKDLGTVDLTDKTGEKSVRLPTTGRFDGLNIVVSPQLVISERIFTALHLFGHSVQCCSASEAEIVKAFFRAPRDSEEKLQVLEDYEFRAAQFGMRLLHDLGMEDLARWFTDFVHTDHKMVAQSYKTGTLPPIADCFVADRDLVEPATIPADLQPHLIDKVSIAF